MWVIIGVIFIGTFVYLYINSQKKEAVYELVNPTIETIERTTVLTGKIEPRDEIEIKPQISGIINEVLVEAGDHVNAGDIIAKIKVIPDETQLSSAENRVKIAEISLEEARTTYERTKNLYEKKFESREKFETDEATYRRAKEELAQAKDQLTIVRDGVSSSNAQSSNTLVRSTVTGIVLEVPVKVGSSVIQANTFNDGTTVATIADMNNLIFKGNVDETEVGSLTVGMPMTISIGALPDFSSNAVIEYISPKGTETNGANTFEIKAAISIDPSVNLRAGYSANASVALAHADSVLRVPESVVEFVGDSTFVYCLTDTLPQQTFKRTVITTGTSDGINIEIKSGIDKNARLRGSEIKEK